MEEEKIKRIVRESYAKIAEKAGSCCDPTISCRDRSHTLERVSRQLGYTEEDLRSVPEGANLGLGCGNPVARASLKEGETVLDLGSGAGFDCFLAANKVGKKGRVIGVDMTQEMVDKAREKARKNNYENVEFRLGEIENLPVADNVADVIISNCVINLSPNKKKTFKEAYRALKPGGRLMVSDIVLLKELPEAVKNNAAAYIGCLSGAIMKEEYLNAIKEAGFQEVEVVHEAVYPNEAIDFEDRTVKALLEDLRISMEEAEKMLGNVVSIKVNGVKPI